MVSSLLLALPLVLQGAEGIRLLPESAEALGQVGGNNAFLSDPSVVRLNPANLSFIDTREFMISSSLLYGDTDFQSPAGVTAEMQSNWKATGGFYLAGPVGETPWTVGFGMTAPYGLDMKWDARGAFAFVLPHDIYLMTMALSPAASIQINDRLSLGVGLDIMRSQLELTQRYPWAATGIPGAPPGIQEFEATGWGVTPVAAVNWEFLEGQRISLVARLPMDVDLEGDYHITNIPAPLTPLFAPGSDFESNLEYPGSVALGYGIELTEALRLGIDFQWIQNSTHGELPLNIGANQALLPADRVILDWDDSWTLGFGTSYDLTENFVFRAGYQYADSPMSDRTYTPAVPANDRHLISLGLGWHNERQSLDFAYLLGLYADRSISDNQVPAYNGDWEFLWHQFTMSYTFRF